MKKIALTVFLFSLCSLTGARELLVTQEEMIRSIEAANIIAPKLVAPKDAPTIELLAPDLKSTVTSPTSIQLKFIPTQPSQIVSSSFRVLYGSFQIDITNRLMPYAEVSDSGVNVKQAKLPSGSHRMILQVTDNAGRQGFRTIEFDVK